jgi:hypothetical protein
MNGVFTQSGARNDSFGIENAAAVWVARSFDMRRREVANFRDLRRNIHKRCYALAPCLRNENNLERGPNRTRKIVLFYTLILTTLFCFTFGTGIHAKDINLGWSDGGSWTTLPYIVAKEKGFFERKG